jgi:hypothetical protein
VWGGGTRVLPAGGPADGVAGQRLRARRSVRAFCLRVGGRRCRTFRWTRCSRFLARARTCDGCRHASHICAGTGPTPAHICAGTGLAPPTHAGACTHHRTCAHANVHTPTPRTLRHGHNHARKHSHTDTHPRARARAHGHTREAAGGPARVARNGGGLAVAARPAAPRHAPEATLTHEHAQNAYRAARPRARPLCSATSPLRRGALRLCVCVRVRVRACVCVCVSAPDGRAAVRSPVADAEGARGWPAADPLELPGVP